MAFIDVVSWDDSSSGPAGVGPALCLEVSRYEKSRMISAPSRSLWSGSHRRRFFLLRDNCWENSGRENTRSIPRICPFFAICLGCRFGGKNPFFAEVWFVNKVVPLNIDWIRQLNPVAA